MAFARSQGRAWRVAREQARRERSVLELAGGLANRDHGRKRFALDHHHPPPEKRYPAFSRHPIKFRVNQLRDSLATARFHRGLEFVRRARQ